MGMDLPSGCGLKLFMCMLRVKFPYVNPGSTLAPHDFTCKLRHTNCFLFYFKFRDLVKVISLNVMLIYNIIIYTSLGIGLTIQWRDQGVQRNPLWAAPTRLALRSNPISGYRTKKTAATAHLIML